MFCSRCGTHAEDGTRFCQNCGAQLQAPGGVAQQPYPRRMPGASPPSGPPRRPNANKGQDPYRQQIQQLKLQIRQLKLNLKQITTNMSNVRSQYNETAAFVPRGLLRWGDKAIEDFRLLGPQQQKQQLQQEIMQLEQQLLGLQQAQAQWKSQQ
ncbi:MAG TPA: zinc ribbon domain-containing protein [Ktedonosporobacter sp.]|nr:zinc ribbon domain-containing protein [Ktedonosporobacter sp.]